MELAMLTNRQKQIINSSLELISEKGIQGFTIKNLAQKVGITQAAIYRHYESKVQILIQILDDFEVGAKNIFKNSDLNTLERIEYIFTTHFNMFSKNPALAAVVFSEELFRNEKILKDKVKNIINDNNEHVIRALKEGQNAGIIRNDFPAEHFAIIIMGSLRLLVKKWELNNYEFNLVIEGKKQFNTISEVLKN